LPLDEIACGVRLGTPTAKNLHIHRLRLDRHLEVAVAV
jgi:hypothetical protein